MRVYRSFSSNSKARGLFFIIIIIIIFIIIYFGQMQDNRIDSTRKKQLKISKL